MAVKYPPPSPPFIRARHQGGRQTPKAIVLHGTVSSDNRGTARNIARWWNGPTSPVTSAHYVVDPGETIQCVGDHSVAYHCGYNTGSIAVELCDEQTGPAGRWKDADSSAILARAARLVAELCLAYGIEPVRPSIADLKRKGPHGIYGHNDSRLAFGHTSHTDPRDFDWAGFLRLVRAEIAKIKGEGGKPVNTGGRKDRMKPEAYFVGARGSHVKWLANRLIAHGLKPHYKNGPDRFFSEGEDRKAVAAFQRAQGWTGKDANGLPGPETLKRLAAKPKPAGEHKEGNPPKVPTSQIRFAHASMQFSDKPDQVEHDAAALFARFKSTDTEIITGTEANDEKVWRRLKAAAESAGYRFYKQRDCWVAVQRDLIKGGWKAGYVPVIESFEGVGRHTDKGIVWVSFETEDYGRITVGAAHYLTKGRPSAKSAEYRQNLEFNARFGPALTKWAKEHGAGSDLVFYGGDQNIVDRTDDTFFGAPLKSAWDELGKWENTGHGNIDVIASYNKDGRVSAKWIRALDDSEFRLFTDHFLVEAAFAVRHLPQG